jgi:CheY-like chemotaxis protein
MDTEPHKFFSLEDKENLLDLGAAAAQLAKEKLQTALNLSAERANIVVSMMHHLRTPMTSLNFATSLLCNDVHNIRTDYAVAANQPPLDGDHAIDESKDNTTPFQPPHSVFQSFESSFTEISNALNQLNILVDSSLSLGQAIIKCSTNEVSSNASANLQAMDPRSRFTECNIIDYLSDMFQNNLPVHNHNLEIEWIVDTTDLVRGSHVTFPDAVMLIVISTVSHMSTESNSLGFHFSFEQVDEDDMEYPELISKMLEGRLSIKVFAKDSRAYTAPIDSAAMMMDDGAMATASSSSMDGAASTPRRTGGSSNSQQPGAANGTANGNGNNNAPDVLSKQNFLSIDKILRAINGSSREYVDDVMLYATMRAHQGELLAASNQGDVTPPPQPVPSQPEYRTIHEFLVPCKILLTPFADGGRSPNQQQQHLRFYRPSSKHLATQSGGDTTSAAATPMHGGSVRITPSSKTGALHHPHAQQQVHLDAPHLSSSSADGHPTAQGSTAAVAQSSGVAVPPPINTTGGAPPHSGGAFGLNLQPLPTGVQGSSKAPATVANASTAAANATVTTTANSAAAQAAAVDTSPPQPETRQLRVLVVEDTIPVQKLLTRWLQNQDCHVTCASNGKVGLELLTSQAFDIAFVDFLMPVMLGITTMKLFQAWLGDHPAEKDVLARENASVLIVGMSATALESEQEEAFNYGMHFFCPKPVSLELLRIILDAKRAHAERLDASIDMICDVTGTDANDGVATAASVAAAAAAASDAAAAAAAANGGDANGSGGGAAVNPKNKWTFFRSCRQARSNAAGNGGDEGNATDDT